MTKVLLFILSIIILTTSFAHVYGKNNIQFIQSIKYVRIPPSELYFKINNGKIISKGFTTYDIYGNYQINQDNLYIEHITSSDWSLYLILNFPEIKIKGIKIEQFNIAINSSNEGKAWAYDVSIDFYYDDIIRTTNSVPEYADCSRVWSNSYKCGTYGLGQLTLDTREWIVFNFTITNQDDGYNVSIKIHNNNSEKTFSTIDNSLPSVLPTYIRIRPKGSGYIYYVIGNISIKPEIMRIL